MSKKYELTKIRSVYERVLNEDIQHLELSNSLLGSEPQMHDKPSMLNIPKISIGGECSGEKSEEKNSDMAKSEIFNIVKDGSCLLDMIRDDTKMEPWMLSKLVKASDYINSVKKVLEYDNFEKDYCTQDDMQDIDAGLRMAGNIKGMLDGEGLEVNEAVLKNVIFNIECIKASK